jgi:uncharacterized Zn-binding protein involved in type VI secretion
MATSGHLTADLEACDHPRDGPGPDAGGMISASPQVKVRLTVFCQAVTLPMAPGRPTADLESV